MPHYQLIQTPDALESAIQAMEKASWLTVDTEFQRESTYRAKLCLVQVGDGRNNWLFDALELDLAPLWERLKRSDTIKVMHSADQDNEVFVQLTGACFEPLFDTQIAATLLGIGDQMGYAGLVKARLGIEIDKSMSRTDWTRRPLSEKALDYAAADVHHLARLYPELRKELTERGRLSWLEEDSARLCQVERYLSNPAGAWQRLKGLGRLRTVEQHIAAALADWREREAEAKDRPRRWILSDTAILVLSQRRPSDAAQVAALKLEGVSERLVGLLADTVLPQAYAAAEGQSEALVSAQKPDDIYKSRLKKLNNALRETATRLNIPAAVLAPRADVERLMGHGAEADIPLLKGWRMEQAGQAVLGIREQFSRTAGG